MNARMLFVHALSPLHSGTGQGAGAIDLPIARERATRIPYLPGSSIKGVLRSECTVAEERRMVFGPDKQNAELHAGSAQFADARLLLLPVRSLTGTVAWVTSPWVLRRFQREAQLVSSAAGGSHRLGPAAVPDEVPQPANVEGCCVTEGSKLRLQVQDVEKVVIEDLDPIALTDTHTTTWGSALGKWLFPGDATWQGLFHERFCVVHDDVMTFLLDTAVEVIPRVRVDENAKTVERGGLWYEEALPTETVLAGPVVSTPIGAATHQEIFRILSGLVNRPLQMGGKATIGRGLCQLTLVN